MLLVDVLTLPLLLILARKGDGYRAYYIVQLATLLILNICYVLSAFINPGIIRVHPNNRTNQFCDQCQMFKEVGQKHCEICRICIRKAAHHCPLLGTHIGENNQIVFFLYVLGVFLWAISITVSLSVCLSK
jgi:ribosomal protein S14